MFNLTVYKLLSDRHIFKYGKPKVYRNNPTIVQAVCWLIVEAVSRTRSIVADHSN